MEPGVQGKSVKPSMIERLPQKLVSALLGLLGALIVSNMVDMTPVVGSPQIDYPSLNYKLPFWPQLALAWTVIGLGGALITAIGMAVWVEGPANGLNGRRTALIAATWFVILAGTTLAGFLRYGTMGPLYVQQPIFRFALVNGLVSTAVITAMWGAVSLTLVRWSRLTPMRRAVEAFIGVWIGFGLAVLMIALVTGLPALSTVLHWWPAIAFLACTIALLAWLLPSEGQASR